MCVHVGVCRFRPNLLQTDSGTELEGSADVALSAVQHSRRTAPCRGTQAAASSECGDWPNKLGCWPTKPNILL